MILIQREKLMYNVDYNLKLMDRYIQKNNNINFIIVVILIHYFKYHIFVNKNLTRKNMYN